METLCLSERLLYNTIRIVCQRDKSKSIGTGFFFSFKIREAYVPVIVTNKHVVEGASSGEMRFTLSDGDNNLIGDYKDITIGDFDKKWIRHPDSEVDLCIMFFNPIAEAAKEQYGINIFKVAIGDNFIPEEKTEKEFKAIENIIMIGYPNALWDMSNNLPIARRGITATHPAYDYNGKPEFLIDAACIPGSSGSPVFLYNEGGYTDKSGTTKIGSNQFYFLGILYAGPVYGANGEIEFKEIETRNKINIKTNIPINLGKVIKSKRLNEYLPIIERLLEK